MARTAKLTLDDRTLDLPLVRGADGEEAVDLSGLRGRGLVAIDDGLRHTVLTKSAITYVDGERGVLRYRGIAIEELAARSNFVETSFLLIYGHLPSREELDKFHDLLTDNAALHESFKYHFEGFPVDAPPMAMLSSMVSTLACFYHRPKEKAVDDLREIDVFDEEAAWLLSKVRTIAAYSYRRSMGLPFIYTDPRLSYAGDFLHMMFSEPFREYVAPEATVEALNQLLILHADHEMGGSTTTVRVVGSSRANLFASCAAGISSLWGPVHGGATIAVVELLESIQRGEMTAEQVIARARERKDGFRLAGFGHPVYRSMDPRAKILRRIAERLLGNNPGAEPLLDIALDLEAKAAADAYFADHRLFPNADFYNGIVMRAIGIPRDMYSVFFAIGRMPGWIAHWREQAADPNLRIIRPRQLYVGPDETQYTPIDAR
ncbi:Citrate synthase 1 [Aquisphaera giovannonii]|uniref:Citrate synthase n=1 Tax=Aquisphaera giovannonii TaxID=406548 RepID=A0A5B9VY28_9BACT|nr:citrate/2-methylcitrate synthase [Aquisphaera giovannonii]QEH32625.1 Citrate synthase 1 [Aquisphaera giovannonii]